MITIPDVVQDFDAPLIQESLIPHLEEECLAEFRATTVESKVDIRRMIATLFDCDSDTTPIS
jgi:hypothetical protein